MKKTSTAALAAIAALTFAGCSSGSGAGKTVAVGQSISLSDKVTTTIDKIVDPADPAEGTQPPAGYRLVAVEFKVANDSASVYPDNPGKATLTDTHGHAYVPVQVMPEVVTDTASGTNHESSDVPGGDSSIGVVVFEVPVGTKAATVQFVAGSGNGQKGKWKAS